MMFGRKIIITCAEYDGEIKELAEAMSPNNFIVVVYVGATSNYVNGVNVTFPKGPLVPDAASLNFCEPCDLVLIYGETRYSGAALEFGRLIKHPSLYLPKNLDTFDDQYVRNHIMKYPRFVGFGTVEQYEALRNPEKFIVGIEKLRRVRRLLPTANGTNYLRWNGISDTINDIEDIIRETEGQK